MNMRETLKRMCKETGRRLRRKPRPPEQTLARLLAVRAGRRLKLQSTPYTVANHLVYVGTGPAVSSIHRLTIRDHTDDSFCDLFVDERSPASVWLEAASVPPIDTITDVITVAGSQYLLDHRSDRVVSPYRALASFRRVDLCLYRRVEPKYRVQVWFERCISIDWTGLLSIEVSIKDIQI